MKKTKAKVEKTLPSDFSASEPEESTTTPTTPEPTTPKKVSVEEIASSPIEEEISESAKDESVTKNTSNSEITIEDPKPVLKTTQETEDINISPKEEESVKNTDEKVELSTEPTEPIVETSTTEPETKESDTPIETETPSIPSVDLNADLKIEEAPIEEEIPLQEKKGNLLFIIGSIVGILILGGVITFSILYFKTPAEKQATAEPTSTPTPQVTEAPSITLNKVDFDFEILNASGISGQAGKTQTVIEDLGYKVTTVGNANSRETGMKLLLKASLTDQKDLLITDLKKEYPEIEYSGTFDSDTVNARIIVGL